MIVADNDAKTFILEFITGHDASHTEAVDALKSILREVGWNCQSESLLRGRALAPERFSIELLDVTPKNDSDELDAMLIYYNSSDSPGGTAVFVLVFRDKKFLDCHSRSAATRMLQPKFELNYADRTGDGRLEFDVTECGAITYRYALKNSELVRCDFIVLKPNIFNDAASQKKFEDSGEYLAQ